MCQVNPNCGCDIGACSCPCATCQRRRDDIARLVRLRQLEDRLERADICVRELAELIFRSLPLGAIADIQWMQIEEVLERRLDVLLAARLNESLRNLLLYSRIESAHLP